MEFFKGIIAKKAAYSGQSVSVVTSQFFEGLSSRTMRANARSLLTRIVSEDFMIQRDPAEPNNVATIWLVDTEGFLRGVYHAASEDAIRDAVEDIALLKKERDVAEYALEQLAEVMVDQPDLPVLGPEGHTIPAFAFTGIDSVEISHRTVEGKVKIVDYFFTHCPTICHH